MGLRPLYTRQDVEGVFDGFLDDVQVMEVQTLQYVGEEFINRARSMRTYTDRTGNLRSSIGYILAVDGKVHSENSSGPEAEGASRGKELAGELLSEEMYGQGIVLIGYAGMDYAGYVESLGYDVITGPASEAMKLLQQIISELS